MSFAAPPLVEAPRARHHHPGGVPEWRDIFGLASLLLGYPDEQVCALRADLSRAVSALPDSRPAEDLARFLAWFAADEPSELQRIYVETFDHKRRNALYVTFATHGDSRERGAALLSLRNRYQSAGFRERGDELPDYLPTVLEFAAQAEVGPAAAILAEARTGIELIEESLVKRHSPYADVLRAVLACQPGLPEGA